MTRPVPRWLPLTVAVAAAFAGGLAVGSRAPASDSGHGTASAAATPTTAAEERPAPPSIRQPELARSRNGAIDAAARLTAIFDGPALLDDHQRGWLLATHGADAARAQLDATLGEVARLTTDAFDLTEDDLRSPGLVWRSVPAGARIVTFTPDRAIVSVWGTGVVIVRGVPLVQLGWRTTRVEVVWEREAWRLVAFGSEPGPQPPAVGGTPSAEVAARAINEFEPLFAPAHTIDIAS